MKIIHTADLHLNSKLHSHFSLEKAEKINYNLLFSFEKLCEQALQKKVSYVLICGDFFDGEVVSPYVLQEVSKIINKFKEIKFLFVYGNHDYNPTENVFKNFPDNFIVMSGNMLINDQNVTFSTLQNAKLGLDQNNFNVVLAHGSFKQDLSCDLIDLNDLKDKNIDYLALGHIHTNRLENFDVRGSWAYSGALSARGFDECGEKGYYLIDTDDKTYTFCPIDGINFYSEEIDITNLTIEQIEELAKSKLQFNKNSVVRLVIKGEIKSLMSFEYLRQYFSNKFFHFEIKDLSAINYNCIIDNDKTSLKSEFLKVVNENNFEYSSEIIEKGLKYLK